MTIIELNKKFITVPTEWNELSQQQLLQVMECLFMSQYTGDQGVLKLLKILTNMSWFQFFRTKPEELEEFYYLAMFLLSDKKELTRQLIPEYKGFYGPASDFDNLLMKELAICDSVFMQWADDRENIGLLDNFIALLYREPKHGYDFKRNPEGDPRVPFNQNISEWNAKHTICKWPMSVKLAIAYWYDGCRWKLVDSNDEVFGGSGEEASKYGLVSVMLSVAEGGALGDFEKVENQYVHTVMMQLNESIRKAKEQEKAMKA